METTPAPTPAWRLACLEKQKRQRDAIPIAWRLTSPPDDSVKDVRDIPRTCGILTDLDLAITELAEVKELLHHLRGGRWSAAQVTTAYLKRAIVAHQLVCSVLDNGFMLHCQRLIVLGELLDGILGGRRSCSGC